MIDEGTLALVRIPPVAVMDDETFMKHLELRHEEDLAMKFLPEPEREKRRLAAPGLWRRYHEAMHRLYPNKYDHRHNEE